MGRATCRGDGALCESCQRLWRHRALPTMWRRPAVLRIADDAEVTIVLQRHDATITGTLRNPDGTPATGIHGEIYAWTDLGMGVSQVGTINATAGTYEINVAAATWNLGYYIHTDDYLGHSISPRIGDGDGNCCARSNAAPAQCHHPRHRARPRWRAAAPTPMFGPIRTTAGLGTGPHLSASRPITANSR